LLVRHALQVHRALAPPGARAFPRGRTLGVEADVDVLTPWADARVQVEERHFGRVREVRCHGGAERAVGPLRPRAAEEDAVLARVLAAVEGIRKRLLAGLLAIRIQLRE